MKSMSEFSKLFASGYASRKPAPKGPVELSRRCHKGLIVYVSSQRGNSDSPQISKLNFIDLAGCISYPQAYKFFSCAGF